MLKLVRELYSCAGSVTTAQAHYHNAQCAKIFLEIFNLHTLTSKIAQMKDKQVVYLASKSDF
jgi:hypothetical protein